MPFNPSNRISLVMILVEDDEDSKGHSRFDWKCMRKYKYSVPTGNLVPWIPFPQKWIAIVIFASTEQHVTQAMRNDHPNRIKNCKQKSPKSRTTTALLQSLESRHITDKSLFVFLVPTPTILEWV